MSESLKTKTIQGLFWSFIESVGLQGVRFIIGIILARLLFPEQFGLIGMLMIFMAIAQTFLDSGFGAALIQKKDPTQKDICSIFYFNIFIGFIITGIMWFFAPSIASFFNQPILTKITRAMSLIIIINSFGLIQGTILSKQIDFKTQTKVSLIASGTSGVVGIIFAANGFGVWSLVVQQISSSFFRTVLLWVLSTWRPALIFSLESIRKMFAFGSKLLASALLDQIFENIYFLVIGRLFSATDLGFFTRAKAFGDLPAYTLSGLIARVLFPVFSTIQDDPIKLKKGMKKALAFLVLVNFPMMVGLAATARPLVLVLITEKWTESVIYLQLISVMGLLYPLHVINLSLLKALGRSDLFLRLEILKKIFIIINIAITWQWGISTMICGMIATSVVSYYLNSYYTGILIGYPIREQLHDLAPCLIVAVSMGVIIHAVSFLPFPSLWSMLLVQILTAIVVYAGICRLLQIRAYMEIWQASWNIIRILGLKESSV